MDFHRSTPGPIRQAFPDIYDGLINTHIAPLGVTGQTVAAPLEIPDIEAACRISTEVSEAAFAKAETSPALSALPETSTAAIGLARRIGSLRDGVFRLLDASELYSAKVIQRSMIDHHLRLLFLHERYFAEKSDQAGTDYILASDAQEDLSYARTLHGMDQIFGWGQEEGRKRSLREVLLDHFPEYKEKTMAEIKRVAQSFGHRSVIEYLVKGIEQRAKDGSSREYDDPNLLSGYLFVYFQLSSFVHGGAAAEKERTHADRDKSLGRRRMKLLAFYVFQTDLISRCLCLDLLSQAMPDLRRAIVEINQRTENVTYANLLRWKGSVGWIE